MFDERVVIFQRDSNCASEVYDVVVSVVECSRRGCVY